MHTLAKELNSALSGTVATALFSKLGERLYFPKGIISQSAEAKKLGHKANATIGTALAGGRPLVLSAIAEGLPTLSASEAVTYAPTAGVEAARIAWKDHMAKKNPSLDASAISLPVVVPGLTAGISYIGDLFLDEGQTIHLSDPCWDNYGLVFADRRGADVTEVPFFTSGKPGLDLETIRKQFKEGAKSGTLRFILNFPQNPAGYSATRAEADELAKLVKEIAEGGCKVLAICDDAYFGLSYEDDISPESLFARLSSLHENVLAVKIDGPTKEDYVWGLRMGFVTFGCKGFTEAQYNALVQKLMGAIRSSVSCSNSPAQYLMLKTLADPRSEGEKAHNKALLQKRYNTVKTFIAKAGKHPVLEALPFNSGYFMSFRVSGVSAEALRQKLLKDFGIGTVSIGEKYLRIAFSSVDDERLVDLYQTIYDVARSMI